MKLHFKLLPLVALVSAGLTACGGSDSNDTTAASSPQTAGVVTGSYFRHAKVCIDANTNGRCDANETSVYTDNNGAFTLAGKGAVVAEIGTDATRYDPDTKSETAVSQPLVFRAPMDAPTVVSAITTELQAMMDANGGDFKSARTALAQRLGVAEDKLLEDHNKEADAATKAALKSESDQALERIAEAFAEAGTGGDIGKALRNRLDLGQIKNIVVIYAENRGFDNLFGLYPGANGIPGVNASSVGGYVAQKDIDGSTLSVLPPTWSGMTAAGQTKVVAQADTVNLPNKPFQIDDPAGFNLPVSITTRDLVHRFYNNQMQINGGKNDKFAAYSDAGGLSMGYYDGSKMAMWNVAKDYTLADNFFMGAFGGSFLNHQYLICACAPEYPNADDAASPAKGSISAIDVDANGNFVKLTAAATSPTSTLSGPPKYVNDSTLTPKDARGKFYAVNTMQPAYQPSGNAPATSDTTGLYADTTKATTLPPQTGKTIGDLLSAKGVQWAWYAGAWNDVSANRTGIYNNTTPNFQPHHQPFNYYAAFDPVKNASARSAHLKDYTNDFLKDVTAGTLPPVTFYKPQGNLNQHPGYASVLDGDAHIADVISKLKQSPQWKNMVVVITYDENGGFWDHVAPPKADRWGPGTRIPAIIVSPFAKKGYVDHTQYDTASILRLITHRYSLEPLPGLVDRDAKLMANGFKPMGDLTAALDFTQK
ncbi:acid phosphatase [Noviherbaspirillum pedocola]|uniref:Acid phosphatase n=1 Tax=Noviherbaspirillum pedocola TaxID=2801341 RepID=A0A934T1G9_9BURK|nr:acid phosphatase [Noviherbaspirillum pedocola]MBK4737267.1 acid phosphatase [Noviherbaspirillum pedocola]